MAACSSGGASPSGSAAMLTAASPKVAPAATPPAAGDPLVTQARAVLSRWESQVRGSDPGEPILLGDLTSQIGTWEEPVGDNNKAALMAGFVKVVDPLSDAPVGDGEIRWADGRSERVGVLTATEAFAEIVSDGAGECGDCEPVTLGHPVLGTAEVQTARGPATVPGWHFAVEGSSVVVTRAAVADRLAVTVPPWNADDPPPGFSIEAAVGNPEDAQIVVSFVGAPGPASESCGADYIAEAVETNVAIAVIVREHPHAEGEACRLVGAERTATVALTAPLGDRAVLEIREGRPVPVTGK